MKMTTMIFTTAMCRSSMAFFAPSTLRQASSRLFSVSIADVNMGVSRVETLQSLLAVHGAPGSIGCNKENDLEPIFVSTSDDDTPELINEMMGIDEYVNLHPHLYPLARSKETGNLICALRRAYADDTSEWYENSSTAPFPIVEAKLGGLGMRLLALNSELLMRRIVCECDFSGKGEALIKKYNDGLGKGILMDKGLDQPYEAGSVAKLGYGVDKYVLLRVGPFADIYESLALGHAERGDESSSLISAEAANSKISGFASTFLFYARLLNKFPNRQEESRDAARMCLRLPLPSIGLTINDFRDVAVIGQLANESDSDEEILAKLQTMYEKIRDSERDEDPRAAANKSPEQAAIDQATYLLDTVALTGGNWAECRPKLSQIYKSAGRDDLARFVNPKSS